LSQAGNLSADPFLNRRYIERILVDERKQQGGCAGLGIDPQFSEELGGFHAAIHRLAGTFILGKLAGGQHPGKFQAVQIATLDRRLDRIEGIFFLR
jgi:hypothetical protein